MSSLILASLEEPPSESARRSPVSSLKDESLREGSPKEGVPNINKWLPDYGYDDTGLIHDDFCSVKSGITGGGSSYHSRSLNNTPSGRSNSDVICQSFSDFHCSSLHHHQLFSVMVIHQTMESHLILTHPFLRYHHMECHTHSRGHLQTRFIIHNM